MVQEVQTAKFSMCEEEGGGLWAWSTVSEGKIDEVMKGISRVEYADNFKDGFYSEPDKSYKMAFSKRVTGSLCCCITNILKAVNSGKRETNWKSIAAFQARDDHGYK